MTRNVELTVRKTERVCHDLGLSDEARAQAAGFAERAMAEHPINRSPTAIAAGSVYAAAFLNNEKRTQADVADVAGTTTQTIWKAYPEILDAEDVEFMTAGDNDPDEPDGRFPRLRRFLRGDRAVSPVIGVILMVALTVVLAALVGTYVIGLQEDTAHPRPPADFTSDYDRANGSVTVTMTQGVVDADQHALSAVGSASGEVCAFSGSVRAGSACSGQYTANETVRVVWTAGDDSTSYTLHESEAPA